MNIIASKGNYHFCEYENGLYTVDKITKCVGMTIKAGNREEVEAFFISLRARKTR